MSVIDDTVSFLTLINYTVTDTDKTMLEMLIQDTENEIKIKCNIREISDDLNVILKNIVVAKFLQMKKAFDKSSLSMLDFNNLGSITKISVGDTETSFSEGTSDDELLDQAIALLFKAERLLVRFRRLG